MSLTPETTPPETLITVFSQLLSDKYLFSPQLDASALYELIDNLPEDVEVMAQQIITWCQARRRVYNSLKDALRRRGPSKSVPAAQPKDYKTLLKIKLRQEFPEPPQNQSGSKI